MPRGGARKGAGRKPRPLAQKIAEGNPGKRPLKKVEFADDSYDPSIPPEYLPMMERGRGATITTPNELYGEAIRYLEPSGCLYLIPSAMIMDYVIAKYYLLQAQYELANSVIVGKNPNNDNIEVSQFTEAMLKLQKNVLATWAPIWDIVSRNSERTVANPENDLMAVMFGGRTRKTQKKGASASDNRENFGK